MTRKGKRNATRSRGGYSPYAGSLMARQVPFSEAYPQVARLEIEAEEEGYPKKQEKRIIEFAELAYCSNASCQGGGFNLRGMLDEMVKERKTEMEKSLYCPGKEKTVRRSCINALHVTMRIKYKPIAKA